MKGRSSRGGPFVLAQSRGDAFQRTKARLCGDVILVLIEVKADAPQLCVHDAYGRLVGALFAFGGLLLLLRFQVLDWPRASFGWVWSQANARVRPSSTREIQSYERKENAYSMNVRVRITRCCDEACLSMRLSRINP
jgi:hypothetical protein